MASQTMHVDPQYDKFEVDTFNCSKCNDVEPSYTFKLRSEDMGGQFKGNHSKKNNYKWSGNVPVIDHRRSADCIIRSALSSHTPDRK